MHECAMLQPRMLYSYIDAPRLAALLSSACAPHSRPLLFSLFSSLPSLFSVLSSSLSCVSLLSHLQSSEHISLCIRHCLSIFLYNCIYDPCFMLLNQSLQLEEHSLTNGHRSVTPSGEGSLSRGSSQSHLLLSGLRHQRHDLLCGLTDRGQTEQASRTEQQQATARHRSGAS